ncbi:MAG TPA: ABC transporter permease [Candidatus Limnocylindrales bacterium]
MTAANTAELTRRRPAAAVFLGSWASQVGITIAFLVLWALFIVLAPMTFLGSAIYLSFAQTTPYFAIVAMPLTMVIVAGDIDLSFPSTMALGMVGFVWVWQATGSTELGVAAAIVVGLLCGLFNGLVVTLIGLPALVVTIGTQFLYRGLTLALVNGKTTALVQTRQSAIYDFLAGKPLLGIPAEFFWLLLATVIAWALLNRHRLGQNAYVIGDNRQAAQLMGIPNRSTRIVLFMLVGGAAAFAGALNSLRVVNFYPGNLGDGFFLPALAAVFVGGTSVFGGRGSVYGTLIGAFMIGAIQAGIVAAGLSTYWTSVIYGAIILGSISIHAVLQRRFER